MVPLYGGRSGVVRWRLESEGGGYHVQLYACYAAVRCSRPVHRGIDMDITIIHTCFITPQRNRMGCAGAEVSFLFFCGDPPPIQLYEILAQPMSQRYAQTDR